MVSLQLIDRSPFSNPDELIVQAAFAGNYGVNLIGDLLNLAMYEASVNANGITDPNMIGGPFPTIPPSVVKVLSENIGGYYVQITPNAAPTLQNTGLRMYSPGGVELATNAAYAAAVLAGWVQLGIKLKQF